MLDLSHNELKELKSEEFNFTLAGNVTHLNFGHNQLTHFPVEALANLSAMHEINLEQNELREFNATLLKAVRNGLILNIEGNPVKCDCHMRPLRHYMNTLLQLPSHLSNIMCRTPKILSDKFLYELSDDNLNCASDNGRDDIDLQIQTDLTIREILL